MENFVYSVLEIKLNFMIRCKTILCSIDVKFLDAAHRLKIIFRII